MSIPVELVFFAASGGAPLAGLSATVTLYRRRNLDGTHTNVSPVPTVLDLGNGEYSFLVPSTDLPAGTSLKYVVDGTASASPRYATGDVKSDSVASSPSAASAGADSDEVLMRVGDTGASILRTLLKADGTPVDLTTGSPSVIYNQAPAAGGALVVDGADVSIADAANGVVLLAWPDEATENAGDFLSEFVLDQGGVISTYPVGRSFVVRVFEPLGA